MPQFLTSVASATSCSMSSFNFNWVLYPAIVSSPTDFPS
jgi:hypothetical protein